MTTKKTKAEPAVEAELIDLNRIVPPEQEKVLQLLAKHIPPERQKVLQLLAMHDAMLAIAKLTSPIGFALSGRTLQELKDASEDSEYYNTPDWTEETENDTSEQVKSNTSFYAYDFTGKQYTIDRQKDCPNNADELRFYWEIRWNYLLIFVTDDYRKLDELIMPLAYHPSTRKIIRKNLDDLEKAGKQMAAQVENFSKGRHLTPGSFEVAKLIYKAVMDRYMPGDDFEAVRDTFMKYHCVEGATFAKQIMDILKEKMKSQKRESKKPPTLPTLKSWLREYMDTMTDTAEEKQHTKPKGEAKP